MIKEKVLTEACKDKVIYKQGLAISIYISNNLILSVLL